MGVSEVLKTLKLAYAILRLSFAHPSMILRELFDKPFGVKYPPYMDMDFSCIGYALFYPLDFQGLIKQVK